MKKKIIFFGTPDFAVRSLSDLIKLKLNVIAVITNPDKKSGRGKKITFSPIKIFCLEKKIKILQPEHLFDDEFEKLIKGLKPDIGIVVAFKKILINLGIDENKISVLGKGEKDLAIKTPDNTKHPANRRAEVKILN